MPLVKGLTVEQLPAKTREQFGLKSSKFSRFVNSMSIATLSALYPAMPLFMRQSPKTFYMWKLKKMMKKRGITEYKR
jgi:uncharacterized protein (DUF2236 family)